ncbi:hypothetical protein IV203_025562 [Nitzschia inconspicua]|uniref:Uncharacterized protein n=1 Tax=Nitzschia inconspicua TaxID=303405 RepID=A0A9K3LJ87_9STRA|nr:hypothetical protein IV203_017631 [Nitzschia inconspicua]KAG7361896.1 hypothetical protein IV203_025562 [Nitzschia inconspicua]
MFQTFHPSQSTAAKFQNSPSYGNAIILQSQRMEMEDSSCRVSNNEGKTYWTRNETKVAGNHSDTFGMAEGSYTILDIYSDTISLNVEWPLEPLY